VLPSLRLRLVAAFVSVIVVTLIFASVGSVVLLMQQQTEFARQRYGRLVDPFALRVQQMESAGFPLSLIRTELVEAARYYEIRILLLDSTDRVMVDTDASEALVGITLNVSAAPEAPAAPGARPEAYRAWLARWQEQDLYLFVANAGSPGPRALGMGNSGLRLVVAVPSSDVTAAWEQLLPRQAVAGGLALLVAVLISSVVAARITRPLRAMTQASEAMAKGNYEQRIDVAGYDEVAQLAGSFNRMAFEVGRNQRAMRQLIANMTHDLKTPLTSIGGFSQAVAEGLPESETEYRRLGQVIHDEAAHMSALVEDLLYLSRIDSGELALTLDDVNVDALVQAMALRFGFQAEVNEVSLRFVLQGGSVRADGRRLEQVFTNLIDNAIRFAPRGSEVLLRSYVDGEFVAVEVHNGGAPIPPEALPHVFDRFYQGDPSRRRGHQGLGLAIVHELVLAHGGTVAAQSSAESGTTFTVRLRTAGPAPEAPHHSIEAATLDRPSRSETLEPEAAT
jgi:signal transduction histidine kinase